MDLSKLPRLSKTDGATPPPESDAPAADAAPPMAQPAPAAAVSAFCLHCGAPLRAGARFCDSCGAPVTITSGDFARPRDAGIGAEVWISIAVGAILLLMQPRLIQFLSHKLFGTSFAPYLDANGNEVPYTAQLDFWSDLGITLFAAVLLLEGLALAFSRRRALIQVAFALTVVTTAYNLGYLIFTFSSGIAILSALAVAFGGYIAVFEWRLLQQLRPPPKVSDAPPTR